MFKPNLSNFVLIFHRNWKKFQTVSSLG